jgi:hypothetical protein
LLLTAGCERRVTRDFLLTHGFVQSTNQPELYTLGGITLKEAATLLGFSPKDLAHGTNNPPDVDIRLVVIRDYQFAIVGGHTHYALDDPETVCSVKVWLIPQCQVDWPQRHQELIRNNPRAARDECVRHMEIVWDMAALYRSEHKTSESFRFDAQNLQEYRFKSDSLPRCPLGTKDYALFRYDSGPRCPNAPNAHLGAKPPESRGLAQ